MAAAHATVGRGTDWEVACQAALEGAAGPGEVVDLAFLFASASYGEALPDLVQRVREATGAGVLLGCTGQAIVSGAREIEDEPAVSLLTLSLPGAQLQASHISQDDLRAWQRPSDWHVGLKTTPDAVHGWIMFVDPFQIDVERLVEALSGAYPGVPLIGGLASGPAHARRTGLFQDNQVHDGGAVVVAIGGPYQVRTIVSQGAEPISATWTITGVQGHFVESIGQRPALEVLVDLLRELSIEERSRIQTNLLIGLAMDEYRDQFGRGDFLVRNLAGVNQKSGAIAVGARPRVGQTIQFQVRDARAADEELRQLLTEARERLGARAPLAAVLCTCNGRGQGLFGEPDHDARMVAELLGTETIAGFFCNGEIGPVGQKNFLHGYTASIALIVPTD
jgi:small ligand-binding sensory domain FIST